MRRVGAGLLVAVLALIGCKSTNSKTNEKEPTGTPAAAGKNKTPPDWLAGIGKLPGKGTDVPKAGTWAKPGEPQFDSTKESQGVFAGRVCDLNGAGVKRAFITIEPADAVPTGPSSPLPPRGIMTNEDGYFMTQGLTPGVAYILTAEFEQDGKKLTGVVQAKAPAPTLTIQLRDDMLPVPGLPPTGNKPTTTGVLPPPIPGSPGSTTGIPPTDNGMIPPTTMNVVPNATPRPSNPGGGAFSPGGVGANGTVTTPTLPNNGPSNNGILPKPTNLTPDKPVNPERIVNGPSTQPMNAPIPASIPGGPPPLPKTPTFNPSLPPTPGTEKKSSLPVRPGANFALVDMMGRPWDFATNKHGELVLVEFMTTKCVPCLQSLPILKDMQAKYGAAGLQLVGIVCDEVSQNERVELASKYHREKNLNYMLFVEPGARPGIVRDRYIGEGGGYPTAVLLNAAGDVLWKGHPSAGRNQLEAAIQAKLGK